MEYLFDDVSLTIRGLFAAAMYLLGVATFFVGFFFGLLGFVVCFLIAIILFAIGTAAFEGGVKVRTQGRRERDAARLERIASKLRVEGWDCEVNTQTTIAPAHSGFTQTYAAIAPAARLATPTGDVLSHALTRIASA